MEYSDCDFWGLTINQEQYLPHLQSYFLVFNKKIINSEIFRNFFRNVKYEDNKKNIVENYEIALTSDFVDADFKMDSFIKKIFEKNPTINMKSSDFLIKNNFPFFKVSSIADQPSIRKKIFKNYLKNNILLGLIDNHSRRVGRKEFFKLNLLIFKIKNNGEYIVINFFGIKYRFLNLK
jgi:rhamnosyltransferase